MLLTGASGYLGIHVLRELIDSDAGNIYCLVRGTDSDEAERRLKRLLFFYFENSFKELFGTRLFVINGDVTQDLSYITQVAARLSSHSSLSDRQGKDGNQESEASDLKPIDTVFNCAAVVKHFAEGTQIEDVNIGGAQRCVDYCLQTGARLIHISTYSTSGFWLGEAKDEVFTEQRLYIGQTIDNKYASSKFIAERLILDAVACNHLDAKVMRVGNLAARSTDGEFQANFLTNSFMGRIRVFNMLGCCTYSMALSELEFSPINEVSRAVVLLASTPAACVLFHPYNNHVQLLGDVLSGLYAVGEGVRFVEQEEFDATMEQVKSDPQRAKLLTSLLAYQDMAQGHKYSNVACDNTYTSQVLLRLGFTWSPTSWDYVRQMLTTINGFGFFD